MRKNFSRKFKGNSKYKLFVLCFFFFLLFIFFSNLLAVQSFFYWHRKEIVSLFGLRQFPLINGIAEKLLLILLMRLDLIYVNVLISVLLSSLIYLYLKNKKLLKMNKVEVFIVFLLFFLFIPLYIHNIENVKPGNYYDMEISDKYSRIFLVNRSGCGSIDYMDLGEKNNRVISLYHNRMIDPARYYRSDGNAVSAFIFVNDNRGELYFIDRFDKSLLVMDIASLAIKYRIYDEIFNRGDCSIAGDDNYLYLLNEMDFAITKIDLNKRKIVGRNHITNEFEAHELIYNKLNHVLYASGWRNRYNKADYYIYEINASDLQLKLKIKVPGPVYYFVLNDAYKVLYAISPVTNEIFSMVSIYRTCDMKLIKSVKLGLGLRHIIVDPKNNVVVTLNTLVNIIDVYRLSDFKHLRTFKAGRFLARQVILDPQRRIGYVSTTKDGVFNFNY